jgi:beta-aspartyl-peptidase (threonine type)
MGSGRTAELAAAEVLTELHDRVQGLAGIILADGEGRLGLARSTESMPWAARWDGAQEASGR